jgi:hypothetical protein
MTGSVPILRAQKTQASGFFIQYLGYSVDAPILPKYRSGSLLELFSAFAVARLRARFSD